MATNLAIDDQLLHEALEISGFKTKKDTVNLALKEFVDSHKQQEIIKFWEKWIPTPIMIIKEEEFVESPE